MPSLVFACCFKPVPGISAWIETPGTKGMATIHRERQYRLCFFDSAKEGIDKHAQSGEFLVERIGHLRPVNRQAAVIGAGKLCVCLFGELDDFVGIINGKASCVYECIELLAIVERAFKSGAIGAEV